MYDYLVVGAGLYGAFFAQQAKAHGAYRCIAARYAPLFSCIFSNPVLFCSRCYQYPGRRFPSIFFGGDIFSFTPNRR